ncbi:hypothetical protein H4582DRAFT_2133824 [Lactarius indigo]|nr:hypothetical protein H4582DRAFT_2133824 [Lactarius indigo]
MAPSDPPNHPSSASHPIFDNTLPTIDTAPSGYPGLTSAPDLGAAAEGGGSPQPGFGKEKDALDDPPSVNRTIHASTMATLDFPPQLPSVTDLDVAIPGPSLWEPIAERSGDRPPDPSRCQYDVV